MLLKILMYLGIILLVLVIIIALIIIIGDMQLRKGWLEHLKGEKIETEAKIVASKFTPRHNGHLIEVTVSYMIDNQKYENKIKKGVNYCKELFEVGKTVIIDVDQTDYNNIRFNLKWYHEIGAMWENEYKLRNKRNRW